MVANLEQLVEVSPPFGQKLLPVAVKSPLNTGYAGAEALSIIWNRIKGRLNEKVGLEKSATIKPISQDELVDQVKCGLAVYERRMLDLRESYAQPEQITLPIQITAPTDIELLRTGSGYALFEQNFEITQAAASMALGELEGLVFGVDSRAKLTAKGEQKPTGREVIDSLSPDMLRTVKDMLMLSRVLSWTLHEYFDRKPGYVPTTPHELLCEERKFFTKLIGSAVTGEDKAKSQLALYTVASSIFEKAINVTHSGGDSRQDSFIESGLRLGFVTHVLSVTGFMYTTPGFDAVRGELYRSLAHLAKFLGHPITAEKPVTEHPRNATV